MNYRSAKRRCAVDFKSLNLPISEQQALEILAKKGFSTVEVDLVQLARQPMRPPFIVPRYKRGAKLSEFPHFVDCSSFTQWLYNMRGILLPRRSIQQRECGQVVNQENTSAGDLVFTRGYINYYRTDPLQGVGHVGIVTDCKTVIHATSGERAIQEVALKDFIDGPKFRGARRYISHDRKVVTLELPYESEVQQSDDIRWIILQSL